MLVQRCGDSTPGECDAGMQEGRHAGGHAGESAGLGWRAAAGTGGGQWPRTAPRSIARATGPDHGHERLRAATARGVRVRSHGLARAGRRAMGPAVHVYQWLQLQLVRAVAGWPADGGHPAAAEMGDQQLWRRRQQPRLPQRADHVDAAVSAAVGRESQARRARREHASAPRPGGEVQPHEHADAFRHRRNAHLGGVG